MIHKPQDLAEIELILNRSLAELVRRAAAEGVAGCVVKDGQVVANAGLGRTAGPASAAMTADTTFEIASQTKLMTTMATLSLAARGDLSLESSITNYVPRSRFADPELADMVTIDHCLRHSAGFAHSTRRIGLARPLHSTGLSLVGAKASSCLVSQDGPIQIHSVPGVRGQYSNVGAALVAEVIERSAERPYAELIQEEVLQPLGMFRTSIGSPTKPEAGRRRKGGGRLPVQVSTRWKGIAGAISTISDLGRLIAPYTALGKTIEGSPSTIPRSDLSRSIEPVGTTLYEPCHVAGWRHEVDGGLKVLHQAGTQPGMTVKAVVIPSAGIGVILLVNRSARPDIHAIALRAAENWLAWSQGTSVPVRCRCCLAHIE